MRLTAYGKILPPEIYEEFKEWLHNVIHSVYIQKDLVGIGWYSQSKLIVTKADIIQSIHDYRIRQEYASTSEHGCLLRAFMLVNSGENLYTYVHKQFLLTKFCKFYFIDNVRHDIFSNLVEQRITEQSLEKLLVDIVN